jgi:hypothetical protein
MFLRLRTLVYRAGDSKRPTDWHAEVLGVIETPHLIVGSGWG